MVFEPIAFCREHGIPYRMGGANVGAGWVGVNCPFCGDNNFHGGLRGNAFSCWKCGAHPLSSFIQERLDVDSFTARGIISKFDDEDIFVHRIQKKQAKADSIEMPGTLDNEVARNYLLKRKFDPTLLETKYHIRYTGMIGDFKYRIMIPIFKDGVLVSYQGRDYTGKQEIRYKTLAVEASVIDAKHVLYNEDFVPGDVVGVCEGPFDAIRLGDGFVATLGTKVTEQQVRLLTNYARVCIVFDPEAEAQQRAEELAQRVAVFGTEVEIIDTQLEHDPGDMTEDEVANIRDYIGV